MTIFILGFHVGHCARVQGPARVRRAQVLREDDALREKVHHGELRWKDALRK